MAKAWAARRRSYPLPLAPQQLPQRSPGHQRQFAGLRDRRTPAQHGISLALDGVQNFLPAAAEQLDIDRQFAIHLLDQRQAPLKPLARPLHFEAHHFAECRRIARCRNILFTHAVTAQVLQRKINSSLGIIIAYVLPEIGQLQRGTGEIGKCLAISIAISAEVENQMAHRIRRIVAVAEQIFEGFVSA